MTTIEPDRLYGVPHAERLFIDPGAVWEFEIEPFFGDADDSLEWVVEEWTVMPTERAIPTADDIVEWIEEQARDGDFYTEDPFLGGPTNPEVLAAAEALRAEVAKCITWFMADKMVAKHSITIVDGEPMWDGGPMYVEAPSIDKPFLSMEES